MTSIDSTTAAQVASFIERVERVREEIKGLNSDVRDIYAEAKANGFDVAALKEIIKRRAKDPDERSEFEAIVEMYESALTHAGARAREAA